MRRIGVYAFAYCPELICTALTATGIDEMAYKGDISLQFMIVPEQYGYDKSYLVLDTAFLGAEAFAGCISLQAVTFETYRDQYPDYIGAHVFEGCTGLQYIDLTHYMGALAQLGEFYEYTTKGHLLIEGCTNPIVTEFAELHGLTLNHEFIYGTCHKCHSSSYVPNRCGNSAYWSLENGVLYIFGSGNMYDYGYADDMVEEEGTGHIFVSSAPWDMSQVTSIVIKPGITGIGNVAFAQGRLKYVILGNYDWRYLVTIENNVKNVEIADTVSYIGEGAFAGCAFSDIELPDDVYIDEYAFRGCSGLKSLRIPENAKVRKGAFSECLRLSEVNVENDYIANYQFSMCPYLQNITLDFVDEIGHYAFYGDLGLHSIPLGDRLITLGLNSLAYTGLESIEIPASMLNLYPPFDHADLLTEVRFMGCPENINGDIFQGNNLTAYYPRENTNWTQDKKQQYGGTVRWVAYDANGEYPDEEVPPLVNPFTDVKETSYYYNAVMWALQNDITGGTSDTTFGPNKECTRAQVMTFLWKAVGSPEPSSMKNPFSDVKSGKYYTKAVLWALEAGITEGATATTFGTDTVCTREQVVTFIWKAFQSPEPNVTHNPFTDVKSSKYYYKPVMWATENGIASGTSANTFGVGKNCTRAQVITFLYNAFGK